MEFMQHLLYAIITAAVPVITTFTCKFLQALYEEHKSKIKNERAQVVLGQVVDMIASAVENTERIIVYGKDKPERRYTGAETALESAAE